MNDIFKEIVDRLIFIEAEIELTQLENDIEHLDLTINDFEVATEISDELRRDIEEVRSGEKANSKNSEVRGQKSKGVKKSIPAKKVSKKPVKKAVKKTAKKKAVKKTNPRKSATKKTSKKKSAPKKAVKKKKR